MEKGVNKKEGACNVEKLCVSFFCFLQGQNSNKTITGGSGKWSRVTWLYNLDTVAVVHTHIQLG